MTKLQVPTSNPDRETQQPFDDPLLFQPAWCRITLASIGDAIITSNTSGRITFVNSVAESLIGCTLQDALGQPLDSVFRILNEESRRPIESPAVRALRDGVVVGLANHSLLVSKDGTERPIDDSAAPIRDDKGDVVGVVLVFRDVSERRLHEQQVQDALAYADNIIATLREPFIVLDNNLRVKTANAAFYKTFDVLKEQTEGCFIYNLGDSQWDISRLRTLLEEILPHHYSFQDYEIEQDFPRIGRRILLLNARHLPSVSDRSKLILLSIEDITERRQAEVALQTSELRYRRLFETAKDGILILDANTGKILDANPFMTDLLSYPHHEFLGKELWEIGLFKDKLENEGAFRQLQRHGYVRYDQLPLECKDGRLAEVEFISNVYEMDRRRVAQCNIRDISERSRLERQTREQAETLADLHRRKDEFLAMLSHELRNPIAPILNAVQLLRLQRDETVVQQQARTIIERQLGQLVYLVDDLLEVSRISTGKISLHREQVDMRVIVAYAVETIRPLIGQRQHALAECVATSPIWIDGDSTRLEQVVVNLLNNAAKYTKEGGHIWLSLQQEGNEAVLQVRDSGIGIPPALMPRIFDLFTQGDQSSMHVQGGLGIGLCLVQQLVEMHGGKVTVSSTLGQGSEFVVRLPVMIASKPRLPSLPIKKKDRPTRSSLRVLVVDDNVDTATTLEMLLAHSGHDVRTAHDGLTALQAALEYRPNVMILDIGLPSLDGFEVAKRIRQQPIFQSVVLVAMTGYGQESDRQRAKEAGFDHHLVKPAYFEQMQKILATVSEEAME